MCLFNSRYIKGHSSICDVKLSDATREEYAFLFDTNNIPHYGHAINIKHILKAKKIILVAYDLTKAPAVYNLLKHKIDSSFVVTKVIENKNVCLYADLQACQLAQD
jgi:6-phosphogluconolactonase/glucosamine-6-phosphate isomerase/deaminase